MATNELLLMMLVSLFLLLFYSRKKNSRKRILHKYKIHSSRKILRKINSFEGEHKAAWMMSYLKKIDPYVFEELLLTAFQKQGFSIIRGERYSGDNGIDGKIYKDNQLYLIQAKRYSGYIKKQHIQDFIEAVNQHNASGFFIHTGITGENIFSKVKGTNVEVLSGRRLIKLLTT